MRESQFKVLVHTGQYVDTNLLEKGIYSTSRPVLYNKDTTLKLLETQARVMKTISGELFITERYFQNLRQCELIEVELVG